MRNLKTNFLRKEKLSEVSQLPVVVFTALIVRTQLSEGISSRNLFDILFTFVLALHFYLLLLLCAVEQVERNRTFVLLTVF